MGEKPILYCQVVEWYRQQTLTLCIAGSSPALAATVYCYAQLYTQTSPEAPVSQHRRGYLPVWWNWQTRWFQKPVRKSASSSLATGTKLCRCGGIGRHKGLKIPRQKYRTGSSPVSGTIEFYANKKWFYIIPSQQIKLQDNIRTNQPFLICIWVQLSWESACFGSTRSQVRSPLLRPVRRDCLLSVLHSLR